jgi:hypothetical protein
MFKYKTTMQTQTTKTRFVPMLFSTDMVKAILNGTKTETRRIIKFSKKIVNPHIGFTAFTEEGDFSVRGIHANGEYGESFFKLKVKKNDVIWVRETFVQYEVLGKNGKEIETEYKADESPIKFRWKASLFMPKTACRIFLKCTSVKAERLHDIDEKGAINEGIQKVFNTMFDEFRYKDYSNVKSDWRSAISSYQSLWANINGFDSWDENPLVWVYKFEVIAKPLDFKQ